MLKSRFSMDLCYVHYLYSTCGIVSLYNVCKTAVTVNGELLESFHIQVGAHGESVLSSLLFITVADVLTEDVRDGLLLELLYADDLILCDESVEEVMELMESGRQQWKGKGVRVNE